MKRDTVWHELFDRMKGYACPICQLIETRLISYMQSILYEGINDPGIRHQLKESEGLCNTHAYQLMKQGDPLGHAIIYIDLLELAIKKMSTKPDRDGKEKAVKRKHCLFCESVCQGEQIYEKHFADSYDDPDFREKYQQQGLLCVKHFQVISVRLDKTAFAEEFRLCTIQRYQQLINELNEIKRKNDYRYAGEEWNPETKTAWLKAVAIINGYPGMKD